MTSADVHPPRSLTTQVAIGRLSLQHRQLTAALPADRWLTCAEAAYVIDPMVQRGVNVSRLATYLCGRLASLGLARRRWRDNRTLEHRIDRRTIDAIRRRGGGGPDYLQAARRAAGERGASVGGSVTGHDTGAVLGRGQSD